MRLALLLLFLFLLLLMLWSDESKRVAASMHQAALRLCAFRSRYCCWCAVEVKAIATTITVTATVINNNILTNNARKNPSIDSRAPFD